MRRVLKENILPGMRLAKPLYGLNDQIILNSGAEVKENHLGRIKNADVTFLYVEDEATHFIAADDHEAQQARSDIVAAVHSILDEVKLGKHVDITGVREKVIAVLDECCLRKDLQPLFMAMRNYNEYLFQHAVNGYFFAMLTGINMDFDDARLRELGLGTLLRDAGMLQIAPNIVNKPVALSAQEMNEVKRHPEIGFEAIRLNPDISLIAANCALQHHERYNGSGYPRGLENSKIHEFAQITAISDAYASMTANTAYRKAMSVYNTVIVLQKSAGVYFSPELVKIFVAGVVSYPLGAVVHLSNKCVGKVEGHADELQLRPQVRLLMDEQGRRMNQVITVDLEQNPNLFIVNIQ